jgi:lipoprotein-anchoring transpeptidase ErfK/SrfK
MKSLSVILLLTVSLLVLGVTSCTQVSPELRARIDKAEERLENSPKPEPLPYAEDSYEHFVCNHGYPKTMQIYRNAELLKQADRRSAVHICLQQQRGRLYVGGQVAADWPVSTGVEGRETPTGTYKALEKKKEYASNLYGNIKDANGKTVKRNADITLDEVPEGGMFEGSPMPNWQRLNWDGLGMHTGKVREGERLSHGCIRTPSVMATELFEITSCGSRVHINEEVERCFPLKDLLSFSEEYQAILKTHVDAQNKLEKLRQQARDEIAARKKARQEAQNAAS